MRHRTPLLLLLLLLLLMATTRNAETPPNFVPKTLQNRAQKVPNVPSEILEKKRTFACLCDDNRLVKHLLFPPAAAAAPAPVTPSVQKAPAGWENTMAGVVVVVVVVVVGVVVVVVVASSRG